jgi:hypothetical protein
MKQNNIIKISILLFFVFGNIAYQAKAQDSTAAATILGLRYFLPVNKVPYIEVTTKKKKGRIFEPVKGIPVSVYLGEVGKQNLLGKVVTAANGAGRVAIPASFKAVWDTSDTFNFLAESDAVKGEEALSSEITIKKAILVIDTTSSDGIRTMSASLKAKQGQEWIPVKDIEMRLSIKRLLGNLTVGEEETYTSDSTGIASAEFKKDSMPGDVKGNIMLVASVEDNDDYGNLMVEKQVLWGIPSKADTHFWHRTLWSTGDRAPLWLLFIAISIIVGIWGVIIYLIRQLIVIKKLGKEFDKKPIRESLEVKMNFSQPGK